MQTNQDQNSTPEKQNDKEYNFRMLQDKYERQLAQANAEKLEAQRMLEERNRQSSQEEEDDDEPYVDKKKLHKALNNHGQQVRQETQSDIQKAVQTALQEERKQNWIKQNGDYEEVLSHAEKLYEYDRELAETILQMPQGFERQKLVYKNIKALGLHKEKPRDPSIQEKIDQNRRSPYYQPTSVGSAPYSSQGDYSPSGQKNAYDQMQALQKRLRL